MVTGLVGGIIGPGQIDFKLGPVRDRSGGSQVGRSRWIQKFAENIGRGLLDTCVRRGNSAGVDPRWRRVAVQSPAPVNGPGAKHPGPAGRLIDRGVGSTV